MGYIFHGYVSHNQGVSPKEMELRSGFWALFSAHTSVLLESRDLAAKGLRWVYPLRMRLASTFSKHPTFDSDGSCASFRGTLACLKRTLLMNVITCGNSTDQLKCWHIVTCHIGCSCPLCNVHFMKLCKFCWWETVWLNPSEFCLLHPNVCWNPNLCWFHPKFCWKKMDGQLANSFFFSALLAGWNTNVPLYLMVVHHKPFFPSRLSKAPFAYMCAVAYMAHIWGVVINPLPRIYKYIYIYCIYIYIAARGFPS